MDYITYLNKHNIKTINELEKHNTNDKFILYENSSRIIGEDINLDILFNNNPDAFLKSVENFENLKYYNNKIKKNR